MSLKTYQNTQKSAEHSRDTEYRLFAEVTRELISARDNGEKDQAFFKALDWNRRMWTVLSSDCGSEGNHLPKDVRAGIISLSIWVSKYTSQVARGQEDLDALIDVNRTIMEGLVELPPQDNNSGSGQPAKAIGAQF